VSRRRFSRLAGQIRPALAVVGPTAVARKLRLVLRTVQTWAAGKHQPGDLAAVARAIVSVANAAGLGLPTDEHLRTEEICAALPGRAAGVQREIATAVATLAQYHGGVRAIARAMAKQGEADLESTLRRWRGLAESKPRPIGDVNRIVSRLAKFSRAEIRKLHRRVATGQSGPIGDRQAILAYLSMLGDAEKAGGATPKMLSELPDVRIGSSLRQMLRVPTRSE
jgi:hypothetical protein